MASGLQKPKPEPEASSSQAWHITKLLEHVNDRRTQTKAIPMPWPLFPPHVSDWYSNYHPVNLHHHPFHLS